uniref:SEFIR domain-containing protein n=1 Tax=Amphiprion percula TaxID=161767 RepID=A0A3P8TET0_AMPPE
MALPAQRVPHVVSLLFLLLRFWTMVSSGELEMIDRDAPELSCSEVTFRNDRNILPFAGYQFCAAVTDPSGPVDIAEVQLEVVLCCPARQDCKICLQIIIILQGSFEKMEFGNPVVVLAHSKETQHIQNITIPSLEEGECYNVGKNTQDIPKLRVATDQKKNVVLLQLENTDTRQDELMWQMVWNGSPGEVFIWPKGKTEMVIPSNYVAPCLCFKVWWKGKDLQRDYCPFKNQQGKGTPISHPQIKTGEAGLSWNVTAPCRLEAEVWLCKKNLARHQCEEVTGSRQRLQAGWSTTRSGHWVKTLKKFNVSSHPLLCVQSHLEPQCPFTTSRSRWIHLGKYLDMISVFHPGYVWRWLKEDDVKGAVGGGHVVLLYSPDDDRGLGFSVSLDLWSQAELSMLGPVPWLHSRLDRLQRQGGKVVLWGARSSERNTPGERNRSKEEEEEGRSYAASSPCADVFSASLSCILADYLQGRAGERFMLVQFESLPPELPGSFRPLPQLFRGLHVYSLPSQSLGFLTELAGAQQVATAAARRKRAGGLRMASRALAQRLSGFTAGTNVLRLAGMSQNCVGVGVEDSGETVPLQPCLITPPSSPDTNPKVNEMEWV